MGARSDQRRAREEIPIDQEPVLGLVETDDEEARDPGAAVPGAEIDPVPGLDLERIGTELLTVDTEPDLHHLNPGTGRASDGIDEEGIRLRKLRRRLATAPQHEDRQGDGDVDPRQSSDEASVPHAMQNRQLDSRASPQD